MVSCLFKEFGVNNLCFVILYCDNKSVLNILKDFVFYERMKYIELDYEIELDCYFIRDKIFEVFFWVSYFLI